MSALDEEDAERLLGVATEPELKRETLNPFDGGPASLLDAMNELCRGYMDAERDDFALLGEHHEHWAELLDRKRKLVLNCHRDGLKTTVNLCYLALRLEYDAGFQAIWCMNNETLATEKAHSEFNKFVDRNPWLTNLQEDRRTRDTIKKKEFPNGSSLRVGWLDGGIDGERAHLLVLDDLIKARGDGDPKDVREWIEGSAFPMVKDDGRTILVGTRKRPGDQYEHYRSLEAFDVAEFPAILEQWETAHATDDDVDRRRPPTEFYREVANPWRDGESMRVLWPEVRGPEWLRKKRAEMADFRFWREYCLSFIGASGNLIDEADVNQLVDDGGCSIRGREPPRSYEARQREAIVVAHDPAQSSTGDLAAFVAILVQADGRRRLLEAKAGTGLMPSEIKATLADLDSRFDAAILVVENNGIQQYVENSAIEFSAAMRSKVVGIPTTGEKHSWENGIPRLQRLVENGGIQFYRGHSGTEDFITAILSLELDSGKLVGHTPDYVAAWYMAEQGIRKLEESGALDVSVDDDGDGDDGGLTYL